MNSLDGIRVLDLSRVLAGPWSTQILADLGADVVKVERLGTGDDTRAWGPPFLHDSQGNDSADAAYYLAANRNKRSIALDLRNPQAKAIALKLVESADVVMENFRPGVMDRLGLGYEQLKAMKPSLIYAAATGYGPDGPYVGKPGQDLLVQALYGLMAITGSKELGPRPVGVSAGDHHGVSFTVAPSFPSLAAPW
jgi:crotonobetainyl-CoA:carnitine CoA-transferase CaiB-like acyl-CoA transferase